MLDELFNTALTRHRSGDLRAAEGLYRQIITAAPEHAPALHNLGLLAQSDGRILWVPGLAQAAGTEPDPQARVFHIQVIDGNDG